MPFKFEIIYLQSSFKGIFRKHSRLKQAVLMRAMRADLTVCTVCVVSGSPFWPWRSSASFSLEAVVTALVLRLGSFLLGCAEPGLRGVEG